jgi:hypothetical protein
VRQARYPVPMTILVVDAEAFGRLRNPQQLDARRHLYALLRDSFDAAAPLWSRCQHEDRGDGALVLASSDIPRPVVLQCVLGELASRLAAAARDPARPRLRLRAALHAGEVHADEHGVAGADVNFTFRLAECEPLRRLLRETSGDCALIVSDALYQGTVRHEYDAIPASEFWPVPVSTKEGQAAGWLAAPGDSECARRISAHARLPAAENGGPEGGVRIQAGGSVTVSTSNLAGRDVMAGDPSAIPSPRRLARLRRGPR